MSWRNASRNIVTKHTPRRNRIHDRGSIRVHCICNFFLKLTSFICRNVVMAVVVVEIITYLFLLTIYKMTVCKLTNTIRYRKSEQLGNACSFWRAHVRYTQKVFCLQTKGNDICYSSCVPCDTRKACIEKIHFTT